MQLNPSQSAAFISPTASDILFFLLTFVVGYFAWFFAYKRVGRLGDWQHKVQAFDKTILTFSVGGVITILVALIESILFPSSPPMTLIPNYIQANIVFVLGGAFAAAYAIGETILASALEKD